MDKHRTSPVPIPSDGDRLTSVDCYDSGGFVDRGSSSSSANRVPSPSTSMSIPYSSMTTSGSTNTSSTAAVKRYRFLRRLLKFRQMDFEFALWQSWHLFTAPQKVFRNFQYRKQMKDQFARDDPAFLVVLSVWLCASSIGFAVVLDLHFTAFLKFISWVVFVDCIGLGFVVATSFWFVTNKYLRRAGCMDKDVEWAYSFDVHLNAFFPLLIILHVVQLFFYHALISHEWFFSRFFGNSLWLIAAGYYVYITFLGYSALPILQNTQVLLYPMTILSMFFIVTLASGWNISQSLMDFYKYRVL